MRHGQAASAEVKRHTILQFKAAPVMDVQETAYLNDIGRERGKLHENSRSRD